MEGNDVVVRDRLERLLGHETAVRMIRAEHNTWKHAIGNRTGLGARLCERNQPLTAKPLESGRRKRRIQEHVGEDVERWAKLGRRRDESDIAALARDA